MRLERVDEADPLPRRLQFDLVAAEGDDRPADDLLGDASDELLDPFHRVAVVGVRLVPLEHRELGLVPAAERLTDGHTVGAQDEQFHACLVRATGNAEMARVHQDVTERIRIVRRLDFTRADRIDATYQEHAKILRAVIQRKTEQAQLLLKSHIEQSKIEVRNISLHALHTARLRRTAVR